MLTPTGYPLPPQHSSRHSPQHTQHTASTAATPRYPQGRTQTPADAPTPLKRSMITSFGGPRPRFGAKARERRFTSAWTCSPWVRLRPVYLDVTPPSFHYETCWPSHGIAITNSVWCMAYKGGGGVYCAMVAQEYCNRVGFAGGGQQQKDDGLPQ